MNQWTELSVQKSFHSVQFSSVAQSCPTLWNPMDCSSQASPSTANSWSLLKLISIESVMPSNHLILCRHLVLPPSILFRISVFSNESVLHIRWPKYWSFSCSISPSNEYLGLISFKMDLKLDESEKWKWSPCSPRDSQESSPTPQFKSINSSALSFLHSPTLTSIHDHWKKHSFH